MKKFFVFLISTLALSSACAQTPVDPATDKAVRELLSAMKYREQMAVGLKRSGDALPQVLLKAATDSINGNPKMSDAQKKAALAVVAKDMPNSIAKAQRVLADPKLLDDVTDKIVPLYATKFTVAELNQITAFYKSPVAAKMQAAMPEIARDANLASQALIQARMATMLEQIAKPK